MTRRTDGAHRLERVLLAMARTAGVNVGVEQVRATPWASALFVGEQVRLTLSGVDGDRLTPWLATLPEAAFALRTHIVADLVVERDEVIAGTRHIEILALLIEDAPDV